MPANTYKEGSLSTVEGIITRAVEGLEHAQDQPLRRVHGWVEGEHWGFRREVEWLYGEVGERRIWGYMYIKQFSNSVSPDLVLLMASATIINFIGTLWTSLPLQTAS